MNHGLFALIRVLSCLLDRVGNTITLCDDDNFLKYISDDTNLTPLVIGGKIRTLEVSLNEEGLILFNTKKDAKEDTKNNS